MQVVVMDNAEARMVSKNGKIWGGIETAAGIN